MLPRVLVEQAYALSSLQLSAQDGENPWVVCTQVPFSWRPRCVILGLGTPQHLCPVQPGGPVFQLPASPLTLMVFLQIGLEYSFDTT